MFKRALFTLLLAAATTQFGANASESGYVIDDKNLRVSVDFKHSVKAVAVAFADSLREIGINPSSEGERVIHVFGGDVSGPLVKPKRANLTKESTMLRYAIYVDPLSNGSSAQVLLLMRSPSAEGDDRSYDVSLDHPDVIIELEKALLDRVAARLNAVNADQPE